MARSVVDLARLLDILASGATGNTPWSPPPKQNVANTYADAVNAVVDRDDSLVGKRLGWLGDLGGQLPIDDEILHLCESGLSVFESAGAAVEAIEPKMRFDKLWQSWTTLRSTAVSALLQDHYGNPETAARLKPEALWEIERALKLSALEVHAASVTRMAWCQELYSLFRQYDALVLPSAQVLPFSLETHWPERIGDRSMSSYHEWMSVVVPASLAGIPALNVPVGFSESQLPMGMQLMGNRHDDAGILQLAQAYHQLTAWPQRRPPPCAS